MSPLKSFRCSICGKQAPKTLRAEGKSEKRWGWLRRHYKRYHPRKFKEWYR
jgi:hypothetical protein